MPSPEIMAEIHDMDSRLAAKLTELEGERVYSETEQPGPRIDIIGRRLRRTPPTPEYIERAGKAYDALTGRKEAVPDTNPNTNRSTNTRGGVVAGGPAAVAAEAAH